MKLPYTYDGLSKLVCEALAPVFALPIERIQLDAEIMGDLDADSLDLVELRAVLEKKFSIVLPTRSVIDHAIAITGDEARFLHDGVLTDAAKTILQQSLFVFDAKQLQGTMTLSQVLEVMTIRNWVNLCWSLLNSLPPACSQCGHDSAMFNPQGKLICAGCSAILRPTLGDDVMAQHLSTILLP